MLDFITNNVGLFLVILTAVVFFHELGHFVVARWVGVRVDVFSVGFGKEIWGRNDRNGTRWRISMIPLGGYIRMFGEAEEEGSDTEPRELTEAEKKVSFHHKSLAKRAAVVAAGPFANLVFAVVIFFTVFATVGEPQSESVIGSVVPGTAAERGGFLPKDRVVAIQGEEISLFRHLSGIVVVNPGVDLRFDILRDGEAMVLNATPGEREALIPGAAPRGLLGVSASPDHYTYSSLNIFEAAWMSVERTAATSWMMLGGIGEILSGQRDASEVSGPIGIARITGEVAKAGFLPALFFMATLSINLCLINLFPIPVLDGGHLFFYAIEAVRGRPLGPKAQEYGFRFGLFLVLALMILATGNDLLNLPIFEFLKN